MELNSKKQERTFKFINHTISIVLAVFLILLSNSIIQDLDTAVSYPQFEDFEDKSVLDHLKKQSDALELEMEPLSAQQSTINKTLHAAEENYTNEKQSFENWIEARKTLGSPDKDHEVISRTKKLDEYYAIQRSWRTQLDSLSTKIEEIDKKKAVLNQQVYESDAAARVKFGTAVRRYEFKVFLIRLLFAAPILGLGIFFFIRFRRHKFAALFLGFSYFSVYVFFFGLVPYLPSYGGYVRYTVGVLLSVGLGYYAIKRIRSYMDAKKLELQASTQQRAQRIQMEVAEKAFNNHICPSCGKDFLIRKWDTPLVANKDQEGYRLISNFCRHCGLELFANCSKCGTKNYVHLPYCASCGANTKANN